MGDIDISLLRQTLNYDPDIGVLFWRGRGREFFTADRYWKAWNTQWPGRPALNAISAQGYPKGTIFRQTVVAHRAIWALVTGRWPSAHIDHINGVRHDNRWLNLREAGAVLNARNARQRIDNTSGHGGVTWVKRAGKWQANLHVDGKRLHLGWFEQIDDAIAARASAQAAHGFTERHGREVAHG